MTTNNVRANIKISSLKSAKYNPPGRITERNLKTLVASMLSLGQMTPILVKNGVIIEGHRRVAAARLLGWKTIDAIILGGDVDENLVFSEINQTTRKMSGREILHVWLNAPTAVSSYHSSKFQKMADEIGRPLMEKISNAGMSWRIIADAKTIANYSGCEENGHKRVINWLLKYPVYGVCLRAMANKQSPYVLLRAIMEDKPIALELAVV